MSSAVAPAMSQEASSDDGGEEIEATPEQIEKLREVMGSDTNSAIVEGLM